MDRIVLIDCFLQDLAPYDDDFAVVAVDVIRSTTTAVTAIATGRRCFPVPSLEAAFQTARALPGALLVGEQGGLMPHGFDFTNSPDAMQQRTHDLNRPAVLLSSSGTRLLWAAAQRHGAVYAACLRNARATAAWLAAFHSKVAILGAGTRGEFREEDQLACAWIAAPLVAQGFRPVAQAGAVIERWRPEPVDAIAAGKSAAYLRRSGQTADLDFVLSHVDDFDVVCALQDGEIVVPAPIRAAVVAA